jgi:hypothetical protein
MDEVNQNLNNTQEGYNSILSHDRNIELDSTQISNVVLKRLIEEVKNEKENNVTAYNRLHNRHNRTR